MIRSQAEKLLALLVQGRRLTKWQVRDELHIENVGRCVAELRGLGWPIATVWLDAATGEVCRDADGQMSFWLWRQSGSETNQPRGAVAAYQLFCRRCRSLAPLRLAPCILLLSDAPSHAVCAACLVAGSVRQTQLAFA